MLGIGFRDKNGIEIHDGNIIRFVYNPPLCLEQLSSEVDAWYNERIGKEYIGYVCCHCMFGENVLVVETYLPYTMVLSVFDVANKCEIV